MKKSIWFVSSIIIVLIYIFAFIRIPAVDFAKTTFYVRCINDFIWHDETQGLIIDSFSGEHTKILSLNSSNWRYSNFGYIDISGDVIAKLMCQEHAIPKNPQKYYQDNYVNNPDRDLVARGKPNYVIRPLDIAYTPKISVFIINILVCLLILAIGIRLSRKNK